jgi:hypothetical protein
MKTTTILILIWSVAIAAVVTYLLIPAKPPKNEYTLAVTNTQGHQSFLYVKAYNNPTLKDSKIYADNKVVADSIASFSLRKVHGYIAIPK